MTPTPDTQSTPTGSLPHRVAHLVAIGVATLLAIAIFWIALGPDAAQEHDAHAGHQPTPAPSAPLAAQAPTQPSTCTDSERASAAGTEADPPGELYRELRTEQFEELILQPGGKGVLRLLNNDSQGQAFGEFVAQLSYTHKLDGDDTALVITLETAQYTAVAPNGLRLPSDPPEGFAGPACSRWYLVSDAKGQPVTEAVDAEHRQNSLHGMVWIESA
ncbi:hypothetical protein JNJ66_07565 [Candidatus Saccharibacteria bacterium]|nr:hypothetical protein [Candidatus Saccharibacteria bacterium]